MLSEGTLLLMLTVTRKQAIHPFAAAYLNELKTDWTPLRNRMNRANNQPEPHLSPSKQVAPGSTIRALFCSSILLGLLCYGSANEGRLANLLLNPSFEYETAADYQACLFWRMNRSCWRGGGRWLPDGRCAPPLERESAMNTASCLAPGHCRESRIA